ncbi:MAG TPA: UTP--glucose-1-phosphate uridylyltransferase [Acidimicrobiales bacterium]|nr:UTP--glucose-1-phosphate uridylyltransferase [Acidimicrobiales bacterium]
MTHQRPRKAVIPAAGLGTRFLPATKAQPKGMLTLIDKPALQYVVEEAVRVGLRDIVMVVSPGAEVLGAHFGRNLDLERALEAVGKHADVATVRAIAELADIELVVQHEPLGLGHAVSMARAAVGDEPFAVLLGDDLYRPDSTVLSSMLEAHETHQKSVVALREVPTADARLYGIAAVSELDGNLVRIDNIIEKPPPGTEPSNLAAVGRYVFTPAIFEALDRIEPGAGGELQLTDAIHLVLAGEGALGWTFTRDRYDAGNKVDFLRATVELALGREDLGDDFRRVLYEIVDRERGATKESPAL